MISKKTFPFPLTPLLLLVGIFYLNFISRVVLAPLLPVIEKDLGLGHGEAGSLFLFIASGYGVGLFGSGFISSLVSHRRAILLSTIMVGVAMLAISRSPSMSWMHVGLVFVGIFAGLYLPSGIATLTDMISKEHWGKAIAIHELAPNLGFVTAPFLSEALLKIFSWRDGLAILGICTILMGVLFLASGGGGKYKGEPPRFQSMYKIVRNPFFWIMAILFTISVSSSMGVYMMMPLYLVSEIGMDRGLANTIIGLSRLFGIIVLFLSGVITDRFGHQRAMTLFLATNGVLTLLLGLIHGSKITPSLIFLQAASAACLFPVGFTVISLIFPSALRSTAVSFIVLFGFILGAGVIPTGIGYWAETFSFSSGFSLLGVLFLTLLPISLRIKSKTNLSE